MAAVLKPDPNGFIDQECCSFCNFPDVDVLYGDVYKLKKHKINVHYFCLLTAATIEQRGRDNQGILGFLPKDIWKEVDRVKTEECYLCKRMGASVKCVHDGCKRRFHLICGVRKGSLHQFFGSFNSFCPTHKPLQQIPDHIRRKASRECLICAQDIPRRDGYNALWPLCCRPSSFLHRRCAQKMASHAGYYFKCPFCNNADRFIEGMKQCGIFVPEQEASWEREPHAYEELLERQSHCTIKPDCLCPKGRLFHRSNSPWEVEPCRLCGGNGVHTRCATSKLDVSKASKVSFSWYCSICRPTYDKHHSTNTDNLPPDGEGIAIFSDITPSTPCEPPVQATPTPDVDIEVDVVRTRRGRFSRRTAAQRLIQQPDSDSDAEKDEKKSRSVSLDSEFSMYEDSSRSSFPASEVSNLSIDNSNAPQETLNQGTEFTPQNSVLSSELQLRSGSNVAERGVPRNPNGYKPVCQNNNSIDMTSCAVIVLSDDEDESYPVNPPPKVPSYQPSRKRKMTSPVPLAPKAPRGSTDEPSKFWTEVSISVVPSATNSSQVSTAPSTLYQPSVPTNSRRVSFTPIKDAIIARSQEKSKEKTKSNPSSVGPVVIQVSDDEDDPSESIHQSVSTQNKDCITILSDEESPPECDNLVIYDNTSLQYEWTTEAEKDSGDNEVICLDSDDSDAEPQIPVNRIIPKTIHNDPPLSDAVDALFTNAIKSCESKLSSHTQTSTSISKNVDNRFRTPNHRRLFNANSMTNEKPPTSNLLSSYLKNPQSRPSFSVPVETVSSVQTINKSVAYQESRGSEQTRFDNKQAERSYDSNIMRNKGTAVNEVNTGKNNLVSDSMTNFNTIIVKNNNLGNFKANCTVKTGTQNMRCASNPSGRNTTFNNNSVVYSGDKHNLSATIKQKNTTRALVDQNITIKDQSQNLHSGGAHHLPNSRKQMNTATMIVEDNSHTVNSGDMLNLPGKTQQLKSAASNAISNEVNRQSVNSSVGHRLPGIRKQLNIAASAVITVEDDPMNINSGDVLNLPDARKQMNASATMIVKDDPPKMTNVEPTRKQMITAPTNDAAPTNRPITIKNGACKMNSDVISDIQKLPGSIDVNTSGVVDNIPLRTDSHELTNLPCSPQLNSQSENVQLSKSCSTSNDISSYCQDNRQSVDTVLPKKKMTVDSEVAEASIINEKKDGLNNVMPAAQSTNSDTVNKTGQERLKSFSDKKCSNVEKLKCKYSLSNCNVIQEPTGISKDRLAISRSSEAQNSKNDALLNIAASSSDRNIVATIAETPNKQNIDVIFINERSKAIILENFSSQDSGHAKTDIKMEVDKCSEKDTVAAESDQGSSVESIMKIETEETDTNSREGDMPSLRNISEKSEIDIIMQEDFTLVNQSDDSTIPVTESTSLQASEESEIDSKTTETCSQHLIPKSLPLNNRLDGEDDKDKIIKMPSTIVISEQPQNLERVSSEISNSLTRSVDKNDTTCDTKKKEHSASDIVTSCETVEQLKADTTCDEKDNSEKFILAVTDDDIASSEKSYGSVCLEVSEGDLFSPMTSPMKVPMSPHAEGILRNETPQLTEDVSKD